MTRTKGDEKHGDNKQQLTRQKWMTKMTTNNNNANVAKTQNTKENKNQIWELYYNVYRVQVLKWSKSIQFLVNQNFQHI
jgi:hypothetical protein